MNIAESIENILMAVPADGVRFTLDGVDGCAWGDPVDGLNYLAVGRDGKACVGRIERSLTEVERRGLSAAAADAVARARFDHEPHSRFDLSGLYQPWAKDPWTGPDRDAFKRRVLASIDCEAADALEASGRYWTAEEYGWIANGPCRDRRLGIARQWPWALPYMVKADFLGLVDDGQPDDVAYVAECLVAATRSFGDPAHAEAARLLLHPGLQRMMASLPEDDALLHVGVASSFPPAWLPAVEESPTPGAIVQLACEVRAMLTLGRLVRDYAAATRQRPMDCIALDQWGWIETLKRLVERAGAYWPDIDVRHGAWFLAEYVNDMATSFGQQVMSTAILLADPAARECVEAGGLYRRGLLGRIDWREKSSFQGYGAVAAASIRVLARDKTLGGMVEMARDWHRNIGRIAEITAEAARGLRWGRAFKPFETATGLTFACLTTPAALLAEGKGMRNCVVSYLANCMSGASCIVSVKRGGAHVATVEIRSGSGGTLELEQIAGPGNGPVPEDAYLAARGLVASVNAGTMSFKVGVLDGGAVSSSAFPHLEGYLGMFPGLVEAWEPFLPKPLRGAGPAEFVAASGYDRALHARRVAWLIEENRQGRAA